MSKYIFIVEDSSVEGNGGGMFERLTEVLEDNIQISSNGKALVTAVDVSDIARSETALRLKKNIVALAELCLETQ